VQRAPEGARITEGHWVEVFVVDTFIYQTKALAVLSLREVERPRTLDLVPATSGYVDAAGWEEIIDVQAKPIVVAELLASRYEAGFTQLEHLASHPDEPRLVGEIGEIDTTWVVYGTRRRLNGKLIGILSAELFEAPAVIEGTSGM
jgi:hypothetical protein